jgi:hypothetical protein
MLLPEIKSTLKDGSEELTDNGNFVGYTILDFWKWRMSNLLNNIDRGAFAEFIVAKAIGVDEQKTEWREFDIITENRKIKIEVKSASYIQAWKQSNFSIIRFSIRKTCVWNYETHTYSEPKRHADVYVFCLLKNRDPETLDILKLEQWEFYVVKTAILDEKYENRNSISLLDLQKLTEPVSYNKLRNEIFKVNAKMDSCDKQ